MRWHVEYEPVSNPVEDKKGWAFPYNGDEWPGKEGWYWIWTASNPEHHPEPYPSTPAQKAWWDNDRCRFLAVKGDVYAWRKAVVSVPTKKVKT
jgi:hypothetical protein